LVAFLTSFAPRKFLERIIVTVDKTWVHRYELESVAWKRRTSPVAKEFKSQQPSAGNIMLKLFWDIENVI
jgi:hypothetical protein